MNDFWEIFIPALAVSTIFLIVFGFLAFMRYMRYKETVALAERGLLRSEETRQRSPRRLFNIGIVLFMVGLGFFCTLIPTAFLVDAAEPAFVGIFVGVLPVSVGLAFIAIDFMNRKEGERAHEVEEDEPIPEHKNR